MKSIKSFIPNAISFLNLNAGVVAVIAAIEGQLELSVVMIFLGIFFDFFDGMAARLLKVTSPLGVQLDSFADLITSGLAPGLLLMQLIAHAHFGIGHQLSLIQALMAYPPVLIGLFVPMGSAYRLGVFNLDDTQSDSFVGLPTPANALLIASLVLIESYEASSIIAPIFQNQYVLIALAVVSAFILNAPVRLFSFKFKNLTFSANKKRYFFILLTIVLLIVLKWTALPLLIISYILLGSWRNV